jgi:hypothetical protein
MQFTWQELIDRARVYIDDDHDDDDGLVSPESWLAFANVEYAQLYRRWLRMGLITPTITQSSFTSNSTSFPGVLAILGVAEDLGNGARLLESAQAALGKNPYVRGSSAPNGVATSWAATGAGDTTVIELDPHVDNYSSYFVRYVPTVAYATSAASTVELPYGADERLVLGIARRAHIKGLTASAQLERLIMEADAELNFQAFGKLPALRARHKTAAIQRTDRYGNVFPVSPGSWLYF